MSTNPTPYPDVNAVLHRLLAEVQAVLGERFVGLYLYGSLAGGDFDPTSSDIDFVVVTDGDIPDDIIPALGALHARLNASGLKWAAKLEGSYIPQAALRRYNPDDPPRPQVNEGRFYLAPHDADWIIQRHVLREGGVVVAGPAPQTLIDPIQPDAIREAVLGFLRSWWLPMLDHPDPRLQGGEYQAYAVLTMCRALYTLEHGTVASKPAAARWAQAALGERWSALIEGALAWRHGAPLDEFDETMAFIRYTLERSGEVAGG